MRVTVLLGLIGLGLIVPHGILLVPLYLSYWVLRPYSPRPPVTATGPKLVRH